MKEQEQEREERARLDEILQMCAEYQKQIDDEQRHSRDAFTLSDTRSDSPSYSKQLSHSAGSGKPPPSPGHSLHPNRWEIQNKNKYKYKEERKKWIKEYNVNMKWVERGNNGNHWLEIQQRPSASIVQPFVWCLAPSVNSSGQNDFTLKGWRAEFSSPLHLVH